MTKIGIVGATGYVGMEIVRLLANRRDVALTTVVSNTFAGKPYSAVYPSLRGVFDMPCDALDADVIADKADFFILALPHGVSGDLVPRLLAGGKKVIDHSADFRFRDMDTYTATYKVAHPAPELLGEAVYGLPELYRAQLRDARLVGDPGCYPTCTILGIAPLLRERLVSTKGITVCAASGISGAGRKADRRMPSANRTKASRPTVWPDTDTHRRWSRSCRCWPANRSSCPSCRIWSP
jgi:N-acetyl-gamma-glutamyl-phosphate reductase